MPLEESGMGRGRHRLPRSARLKAEHKLRDVKETNRAKQMWRQEWRMGKEVGRLVRQEGRGRVTELLTVKSVS